MYWVPQLSGRWLRGNIALEAKHGQVLIKARLPNKQLERLVRTLFLSGFMSGGDLSVLLALWFEGEYP